MPAPAPMTAASAAAAQSSSLTNGHALASVSVDDFDYTIFHSPYSKLVQKGFGHAPEPGALEVSEDTDIGREAYVAMFGPTVGDRVRLGDTALWVVVERDEVRAVFALVGGPNVCVAGCVRRRSQVWRR